jgi:transposase
MTRLFWLSDEAWAAIDPLLPRAKPGKPRVDGATCRLNTVIVVSSVASCTFSRPDGPATTIYNRYNRSRRRQIDILGAQKAPDILQQSRRP